MSNRTDGHEKDREKSGHGRGHDGHHGKDHGKGHGADDDFEGLYVVSATGVAERGMFLGQDISGEEFTLSYAINFNDPVVETDGTSFTSYIDQEPRYNSVIISAEVGGIRQEDVIENTAGPQETDRTTLGISDDRPDTGADGLSAFLRGESGTFSFFHDSFLFLVNPDGDFTDSISLEQELTYSVQDEDTANVAYSLFDNIVSETTHFFTGRATEISLNAGDPLELFERENLALLGFPVESGCSVGW
ncbi:hypothetical protein [Azospirillum sp. SYSU D00513]|uniref:hypothetical protein n=1 Tax=Azospirillum sp. SYSU D00513 TaxID=2812561 RepID=UPI001A9776B1|nr:hypothetical protein [Azospirillum sp. SYSU D00513]